MRLEVYPNPTDGMVSIKYIGVGNAQIIVTDASGKLVMSKMTSQNPETISLDALSNGVYYISLEHNGKKASVKVIKQ